MDSFPQNALKMVMKMTETAENQPEKAIAFQGAPGANSHLAALQFDPECLPVPCFSFEDALDAVSKGKASSAIIPIENSLHGRVADMHFLLPESGLSIVAEHFMPIRHCLMAKSADASIRTAMSHPQALGQCRHYLRAHEIIPVAYADTAAAAAYVAQNDDDNAAAIAPPLAAELYGLEPVVEAIEDAANNTTRFVVLAAEPTIPEPNGPVMTTLIFEVKNVPAALYKAMGGFATNGVNMTKLESYQEGGSFAATKFYADIEGAPGDPPVDRAIAELGFHCNSVRLLGTYRQARPRTLTD
ncbi:prephenate dehydratase [Parasphingorhabdus marina DSM 22363]|uniref:prephenate dehydratase n=1 Tax=Parasphingorhabdus marina DSM 22363 TaxID=1123272 RepID=A0A1N6CN10_9SPHN|nr:prephenate dehydratase [Parasphingorhabdus marina]SIN59835.1 prephenate dehydratase [Parasphingorhabdus marina DSM 22363]